MNSVPWRRLNVHWLPPSTVPSAWPGLITHRPVEVTPGMSRCMHRYEALPGSHMTNEYAEEIADVAWGTAGTEVLVAIDDGAALTPVPAARQLRSLQADRDHAQRRHTPGRSLGRPAPRAAHGGRSINRREGDMNIDFLATVAMVPRQIRPAAASCMSKPSRPPAARRRRRL